MQHISYRSDPNNPDTDGDCYDDFEKWSNGTSPFQYDLSPEESIAAFFGGAVVGDFVAAENPQTLLGQIAFGFVPMAADARDYFANVFVNQETSSALINLSGFLLDFAPAAGVAGDAAKILPKLADFIIRYVDDAPKVLDAIIQTTKHFPGLLQRIVPFEKIGERHDLRQFSVPFWVTDHSVLPRMQLVGNREKWSSVKIYSHLRPPVFATCVSLILSLSLVLYLSIYSGEVG